MAMTIRKGHTMKIRRHVIRFLCLLGLWVGVGLQAHAQTDTVTYVYTDPQGTPLVKADASGNVIARYDYTPYGNAVASLGSPPNGPGYTGHVNDPETGLVYMQARYYDPVVGRFLSTDPVGPSPGSPFHFNRYDYANNNPIVNIDPKGLYACSGGKSDCTAVDNFVSKVNDALKNTKAGSANYKTLTAISKYVGKNGVKNGVTITAGSLPKNTLGQALPGGKSFIVDVKQINSQASADMKANPGKQSSDIAGVLGAATVAHESSHELDFKSDGFPAGRDREYDTELGAYKTESIVGKSLGTRIGVDSHQEIQSGAENSTNAFCSSSTPQC
jgi:RHS repeat-associated protein